MMEAYDYLISVNCMDRKKIGNRFETGPGHLFEI
jgi:hypothetical protein